MPAIATDCSKCNFYLFTICARCGERHVGCQDACSLSPKDAFSTKGKTIVAFLRKRSHKVGNHLPRWLDRMHLKIR